MEETQGGRFAPVARLHQELHDRRSRHTATLRRLWLRRRAALNTTRPATGGGRRQLDPPTHISLLLHRNDVVTRTDPQIRRTLTNRATALKSIRDGLEWTCRSSPPSRRVPLFLFLFHVVCWALQRSRVLVKTNHGAISGGTDSGSLCARDQLLRVNSVLLNELSP